MIHGRKDYDAIFRTKAGATIQEDEPVFTVRAQDRHFVALLAYYLTLLESDHGTNQRTKVSVADHIQRGLAWQFQHSTKSPDI